MYSCRLENRDGTSDQFELGDLSDDEAAIHAGRSALLVSLSGKHVEIWRERDLVHRLSRDVAQYRNRGSLFLQARPG